MNDVSKNEARAHAGLVQLNKHNEDIDDRIDRLRHQDKEVLSEAATDIVANIAHALRYACMDAATIGDILDRGYQHFVTETTPPQPARDTAARQPQPAPPPGGLVGSATIKITVAQAVAFAAVHRNVSGDPSGPRGELDRLRDTMLNALGITHAGMIKMATNFCEVRTSSNNQMHINAGPLWLRKGVSP